MCTYGSIIITPWAMFTTQLDRPVRLPCKNYQWLRKQHNKVYLISSVFQRNISIHSSTDFESDDFKTTNNLIPQWLHQNAYMKHPTIINFSTCCGATKLVQNLTITMNGISFTNGTNSVFFTEHTDIAL